MQHLFPYTLIDLTHTLDPTIPTWDAGCGFNHTTHVDYDPSPGADTFRVMHIHTPAGIGTHMDAPSHCIPGGLDIDQYGVNELIFPCVVIRPATPCHAEYKVSINDVLDYETQYGPIPKGACVMIHTGWDRFWHVPDQYRNDHTFPSLSTEAASLLLNREVQALGIDTLSPDRPGTGFPVHKMFLGQEKILIENVANLDQMPICGGYVLALPLKLKGGTESPMRLVGLLPKDG